MSGMYNSITNELEIMKEAQKWNILDI
jgi:hypothetical protein